MDTNIRTTRLVFWTLRLFFFVSWQFRCWSEKHVSLFKNQRKYPTDPKNPLYTFRESCLFAINHIVLFFGLETWICHLVTRIYERKLFLHFTSQDKKFHTVQSYTRPSDSFYRSQDKFLSRRTFIFSFLLLKCVRLTFIVLRR